MTQRSVVLVLILSFLTVGIYGIFWFIVTKNEMNRRGARIPTAILLFIPIVSIWWMWKYSEGVELVTRKEMSTVISFILLVLLGGIGVAIVQSTFNKVATSGQSLPPARALSM